MKSLEQYFKENLDKGIIDHKLRVTIDNCGVKFYIHADSFDSDTLDYSVSGNELSQINLKVED